MNEEVTVEIPVPDLVREGEIIRVADQADVLYEHDAIHTWFNLTYANYLVLPRSVLQSMPDEWQSSFVALLNELAARYGGLDWPDYTVTARRCGRFVKDPIPPYNRGRTRVEPCPPSWAIPMSEAASDRSEVQL